MAKPNYSFAKRQRELAKKKKKEEKRQRKAAEQEPEQEIGETPETNSEAPASEPVPAAESAEPKTPAE